MLRIALVLFLVHLSSAEWYCGVYSVDSFLSRVLCYPSTYSNEINQCCRIHDRDYDDIEAKRCDLMQTYCTHKRTVSDEQFCSCLKGVPSLYVRAIVAPTFCGVVNVFSFFKNIF
ncbi:unnamed protein product [Auanema sp. JU1783]|nr:unnamed protein product [Auanema sp. JU1783]